MKFAGHTRFGFCTLLMTGLLNSDSVKAQSDGIQLTAPADAVAETEETIKPTTDSKRTSSWTSQDAPMPVPTSTRDSTKLPALGSVDQKKTEIVRQRFPDGKVQIERHVTLDPEGNYINHGEYQEWNSHGDLVVSGTYSSGMQEGLWVRYLTPHDSKLFEKEPYSKFTPPFQSSVEFSGGSMHGAWTITDKDGKTISQIQMENGQRNGTATWYHPTGVLLWHSEYKNGLLDGRFTEKDAKGKVLREVLYTNGRRVSRKQEYYSNKNVKTEYEQHSAAQSVKTLDDWNQTALATYELRGDEIKHGAHIIYFENGSTQLTANYRNGVLDGSFETWYANGQKEVAGRYLDGAQHGQWSWWHPNGMRKTVANYDKGKLVSSVLAWNETGARVKANAQSTTTPTLETTVTTENATPNQQPSRSARAADQQR